MKDDSRKVLFVCSVDWFFQSHFLPLYEAAASVQEYDAAIACGVGQARHELEELGLRILPVDFSRPSRNPISALKILWQLAVLFRHEKPDLIHFIALKPILLGGLASLVVPNAACVYHLTGLGFLGVSEKKKHRWVRKIFLTTITGYLKRLKSWLILENPDDLNSLRQVGSVPENRTSIFGGAGVDPEKYRQLPAPNNQMASAAFVGRMVWSKGADILIEAMNRLAVKDVKIKLHLYGAPDDGNPNAVSGVELERWNQREDTTWHGQTKDVRKVWAIADFAVVPSRGGEGLPRSLLEAASCARALIVTDVPGCRHFVRDGVEGYIVPPEDPEALAMAMEKVINNPDLTMKMGKAARDRVIDGYSESHVRSKVLEIYQTLLKRK